MPRPPDNSAPDAPPHLPAGYALNRAGLVVPEHSAAAPRARRDAGAIGAAWRKARKAVTAAAAAAVLAIGIPAVGDIRNTGVAARATVRAAGCAAYDHRRDARARGRRVAAEVQARIRQCERAADWAPLAAAKFPDHVM